MVWGLAIIVFLLGYIYSTTKECLRELKKISMHLRLTQDSLASVNSNIVGISISLDRTDARLANVETAANLAYDRLMEEKYAGDIR